ncbi:hypothetical protein Tsubulata_003064 [Turnera subulata]|uniref:Uncharacterized protein n=1 Tax=Turnera subulata TaxID=218843 RepID=A0A9Q0FT68_9ROSI|nr:hypothetical protein Tsubulata_003064 [Turnera subulata]
MVKQERRSTFLRPSEESASVARVNPPIMQPKKEEEAGKPLMNGLAHCSDHSEMMVLGFPASQAHSCLGILQILELELQPAELLSMQCHGGSASAKTDYRVSKFSSVTDNLPTSTMSMSTIIDLFASRGISTNTTSRCTAKPEHTHCRNSHTPTNPNPRSQQQQQTGHHNADQHHQPTATMSTARPHTIHATNINKPATTTTTHHKQIRTTKIKNPKRKRKTKEEGKSEEMARLNSNSHGSSRRPPRPAQSWSRVLEVQATAVVNEWWSCVLAGAASPLLFDLIPSAFTEKRERRNPLFLLLPCRELRFGFNFSDLNLNKLEKRDDLMGSVFFGEKMRVVVVELGSE